MCARKWNCGEKRAKYYYVCEIYVFSRKIDIYYLIYYFFFSALFLSPSLYLFLSIVHLSYSVCQVCVCMPSAIRGKKLEWIPPPALPPYWSAWHWNKCTTYIHRNSFAIYVYLVFCWLVSPFIMLVHRKTKIQLFISRSFAHGAFRFHKKNNDDRHLPYQ